MFPTDSSKTKRLLLSYPLVPKKKKSLQLEIQEHTTSANFLGTQVNVNWLHRNIFKGGEALTLTLFGSTDTQYSGQNNGEDIYQTGIEGKLSFPRFISPWNFKADNAIYTSHQYSFGLYPHLPSQFVHAQFVQCEFIWLFLETRRPYNSRVKPA